jgi:DNA-binding IclR family transcriptional regulator
VDLDSLRPTAAERPGQATPERMPPYIPGVSVTEPEDDRQGIQSVEIAMTVVSVLEEGQGPMSLTQIASASGMTPSKTHRYLVSLGRVGLISQSPSSGMYDLGASARRIGMEALRRMDEVGLASDFLPGLRDRTTHAVNLSVWGDHGPVIVRWDYGSHALPITIRIGAIMPLATSSVGQVFLAHLSGALTEPVLRGDFEPDSDQFSLSETELEQIKEAVLRDGFALTTNAMIPGVTSLAAPVIATSTPLPLVVAVALPVRNASPAVIDSVADELLRTTAEMSLELGSPKKSADTTRARRRGRPSRYA